MAFRFRTLAHSLVLSACVFIGFNARAADLVSASRGVPADASLVLIVRDAAAWDQSQAGRAIGSIALGATRSADLGLAWRALSTQLGLAEDRSFKELLGREAVLVQRAKQDGSATWALRSQVSRATEELLRQRLKPAPRRVQQGVAVMSLEDGRFWLASKIVKDGAVVLLGPASAPELFDQMLGAEPVLESSFHQSSIARSSREMARRADVFFAVRLGQPGEDRWISLASTIRPAGVEVSLLARSPEIAKALRKLEPVTREAFDELATDSYFAIMERGDVASHVGLGTEKLLGAVPPMIAQFDGKRFLGETQYLFLHPSDASAAQVTVAFESTDINALAISGDRLIAQMLAAIWPPNPGDPAAATPDPGAMDFGGAFPPALREVDLHQPIGRLAPALFSSGPVLAWMYSPNGVAVDAEAQSVPGWWVLASSGEQASLAGGALSAESRRREKLLPWVMLGRATPAAFVAEIERRGVLFPPLISDAVSIARQVESASWQFYRDPDNDLRGSARLQLLPKAPSDAP